MTGLLAQMMWLPVSLPVSMMAYGMNLLASAATWALPRPCCQGYQGYQGHQGNQGYQAMNGFDNAPGTTFPESGTYANQPEARPAGATQETKEERTMSDHNHNCCHDETVKLVEYTIVSIKPCDERIIKRGQVIYADDMDDNAFATWVIARYLQGDDDEDEVRGDSSSSRYDRTEESGEERETSRREKGRWLPRDEKRYLRVYHRVLESWARPDDCCDNRQLDVLRGIESAIRGIRLQQG
ncbi:MAG TPA: hypothetical protein VKK31_14275 [Thermoanaerobaculia bacterium]|nr:hypothetical protein [Thermoanaerobaculia bacterium]